MPQFHFEECSETDGSAVNIVGEEDIFKEVDSSLQTVQTMTKIEENEISRNTKKQIIKEESILRFQIQMK